MADGALHAELLDHHRVQVHLDRRAEDAHLRVGALLLEQLQALRGAGGRSRALQRDVGAVAAGEVGHDTGRVLPLHVEDDVGTEAPSAAQPHGIGAGS